MPPWEKTGVPLHFHSSTMSGSAACRIARIFASIFPRQSPSSLIFSSMSAEADSTGMGFFMYSLLNIARGILHRMQSHKAALAWIGLSLLSNALYAQQPKAVANDPPPNPSIPSQNVETIIYSDGSRLMGIFLLASGVETHRTVILLHGFPGYEQNMDLAQALRRDGWNVLAVHYRGAWGSEGSFSFKHCMQDVG